MKRILFNPFRPSPPSSNPIGARTVVVTGDITIDWMLAKPRAVAAPPRRWSNEVKAAAFRQAGGAALLAQLVRDDAEAGSQGPKLWRVYGPRLTSDLLTSKSPSVVDPNYDHAFSIWQPFPENAAEDEKKERTRWRVAEFQGWNDQHQGERPDYTLKEDDAGAEIVVLIDAGLGFSDRKELWPTAVRDPGAQTKWVILRLTYAQPGSDLWQHLVKHFVDRLIVLTSVRDLRQMHAQISKHLSWERTAQETVREIREGENMHELSRCRWVAVSIGQSGAVLVPGRSNRRACPKLVFDPKSMEDEWERSLEGSVLGSATCMTAALVHEVMKKPEDPDLVKGLERGILARRRLHEIGYAEGPHIDRAGDDLPAELKFPFGEIVDVLQESDKVEGQDFIGKLAEVEVKQIDSRNSDWTILETKYPAADIDELAIRIVKYGVDKALCNVPISRFKKLVTVDRHEIEAVGCVARLIAEYHRRDDQAPLCLGVFGPPGAGKSFAVKQVARQTLRGRVQSIEFNLSQFEKPDSLFEAFHRVRDVRLSGKLPLVVWDEFDTSGLAWLRYFLQPMQDGTFQQGEITHSIGRSIFVFAGGTADDLTAFTRDIDSTDKRKAKVRDFVSRLHGFMDVRGPNRRSLRDCNDPEWKNDDPYFIIRRAVILRGILEGPCMRLMCGGAAKVDDSVLRAFLNVKWYKHGIRSMVSIVRASLLADLNVFEISSLPPNEQLELHVSEDFLDLARPSAGSNGSARKTRHEGLVAKLVHRPR